MCVVVVAAAKWKCELWLEETDDGDNDRREPRVPKSGAGTNLIISATWQTLMTPNCCRRCCCCCHCYMYSVHICANSCAFNRSLLSVNFCKFTAHTSTMFINKYENKKRKPNHQLIHSQLNTYGAFHPKMHLKKYIHNIHSPSLEFALIIQKLIDVIVHAMTRFTRVHTPTHTHACVLYLSLTYRRTIAIQITQRAVQNKKQLIGAVAI